MPEKAEVNSQGAEAAGYRKLMQDCQHEISCVEHLEHLALCCGRSSAATIVVVRIWQSA